MDAVGGLPLHTCPTGVSQVPECDGKRAKSHMNELVWRLLTCRVPRLPAPDMQGCPHGLERDDAEQGSALKRTLVGGAQATLATS